MSVRREVVIGPDEDQSGEAEAEHEEFAAKGGLVAFRWSLAIGWWFLVVGGRHGFRFKYSSRYAIRKWHEFLTHAAFESSGPHRFQRELPTHAAPRASAQDDLRPSK